MWTAGLELHLGRNDDETATATALERIAALAAAPLAASALRLAAARLRSDADAIELHLKDIVLLVAADLRRAAQARSQQLIAQRTTQVQLAAPSQLELTRQLEVAASSVVCSEPPQVAGIAALALRSTFGIDRATRAQLLQLVRLVG